ncbi:MAG: NADPH:quinone oxidoreductase family protein [Bacteroidota bacterium]
MKAIQCVKLGPPEDLQLNEVDLGPVGPKQVKVKIESCSVNYPDTLIIQGLYQYRGEVPFTPGSDVAGVVEEVGTEVKRLQKGDRVFGAIQTGGFAEAVIAPERAFFPIPPVMDSKVASSFMMAYGTSYHALKQRAQIQPGETLAILGASGGVGLAAVELGKVMGANVIACASTDQKLELCKEYGADHTINYSDADLKSSLKELSGGGVDVIYDAVGGSKTEPALRAMSPGGRHLVVGFVGGIPSIPLNLPLLKTCQIVGVFWGSHVQREPLVHQQNMLELLGLYQEKKIKPHISKEYPLSEAPRALRDMMERKVKGKIVVVP